MKNYTYLGFALGTLVALAIVFNLWALLFLVLIFGGIGAVIGAHFDGRINLGDIWGNIVGKGRG